MFEFKTTRTATKNEFYHNLFLAAEGLIQGEHDLIANLANTASLLYHSLDHINWAGFYLLKEGELVLGPFHGYPACIRIQLSRGVCGKAATARETIRVKNVHEFQGHIACDARTNSEIVVPMILEGQLIGVLDIDSEDFGRFDSEDQKWLERLVELLLKATIK